MFLVRLTAVAVLACLLVSPADAAVRKLTAPENVRAFLFRADEPTARTYARTPSFAWRPVAGAKRYEFQLSTSNTFRDSGIVYSDSALPSPVIAVPVTLPWITGQPYSLYARARGIVGKRATPWSKPFGFNMRAPNVPSPLPSYPGLLRWTPIEGATAYEVWLVDIPKFLVVYTNVLDEREFYSFHQGPNWIGSVKWRIRALRSDLNARANGLPAVTHGPWSPVYQSVNPPFSVAPLQPMAAVSDVVSDGSSSADANRLMPGFAYSGNQASSGASSELYRVYVFTDSDCVNTVFTGSIVGSPAYAPRPFGPLALPRSTSALVMARSTYLADGDPGNTFSYDYESVTANESLPSAKPTTSLPAANPGEGSDGSGDGDSGSGSGDTSSGGGAGIPFITVTGELGAPVDLWDTDWPSGGYYWTVVPVEAKSPDSISTSVGDTGTAIGDVTLPVANAAGFSSGDVIKVGNSSNEETVTITEVSGNTFKLATPLKVAHGPGEPVLRTSGNLLYRDLELPQEACAEGRIARFGKMSEPALTSASGPFVTGLSPRGRHTSATASASRFYGAPLIAWSPAIGASVYEVQWSKRRYPFTPEPDTRTGALGCMTVSTSTVLPLLPGTWYYRVRGISYSLPTGAQQMGWSETVRVVVAKPVFRIGK
jgi:hypothetical protein